jgi:hypothetical protein
MKKTIHSDGPARTFARNRVKKAVKKRFFRKI